ncbi:hypothetical protein WMF11_11860 [Sorangium sp. So ce295]|uniref:hypothetical protein n=1 Tax=Sorangium sp. So ce295 TaxID=3133295 RepID=UPI003F6468D5
MMNPSNNTRLSLVTGATAIVMLSACAVPQTPVYDPDRMAGYRFCQELSDRGEDLSTLQSSIGWGLAIGAIGAITTGTILTAVNSAEDGSTTGRIAGMSLTTGGVALVPLAYGAFARADAGTRMGVAADMSLSQKLHDRDAYDACVAAKADWLGTRSDSNAFALQALTRAKEIESRDNGDNPRVENSESTAEADKIGAEAARANADADADADKLKDKTPGIKAQAEIPQQGAAPPKSNPQKGQ